MGYYSKVAIQATEKVYEKIMSSVKEYNERTGNQFLPDKTFIRSTVKRGFEYVMYWENVKWYENFPDIQSILSVLDEIDKMGNPDFQYELIRVGEENGDIENRCNNILYSDSISTDTIIEIDDSFNEIIE